jgi:HD-GYP domain-containing protein (c-di-GMP phosphodiesterase class II)
VEAALRPFYLLRLFSEADAAIAALTQPPPGVIIAGETAGAKSGLDFVRMLRQQKGMERTPLVFITDQPENRAFALLAGVDDCLIKPYRRATLVEAVSSQLNTAVEARWERLPGNARAALRETLVVYDRLSERLLSGEALIYDSVSTACAPLVEAVDHGEARAILGGVLGHTNYTFAHSVRVATLLALFSNVIGLPADEQLVLATGGLLLDVGKMSIPHAILNKSGTLTDEEFGVMRNHVIDTMTFLARNNTLPNTVRVIAGLHHEKLDGSGYPKGLAAGDLNEIARMAAIADVFCALTDYRAYKKSMSAAQALEVMTQEMDRQLDQKLIRMFAPLLLDNVA